MKCHGGSQSVTKIVFHQQSGPIDFYKNNLQYFTSPHNYYKRKKKSIYLENSPKKARALIG